MAETLPPAHQVKTPEAELSIHTLDTLYPSPPVAIDGEESSIPDIYVEEAEQFQAYCTAKNIYRTHYDCECLAASFLDTRIDMGAHAKREVIMNKISKKCLDASEEAFSLYNQCKGNPYLLPRNIPVETYCSCYGNEYAKLFENGRMTLKPSALLRAQTKAHSKCSTGNFAHQEYGEPTARSQVE